MGEEIYPLKEKVSRLPESPGVYLMKDASGAILYVGKALNLKHRVSSYFGSPQKLTVKIQNMISQVSDIDYFITASEQEALILELNLIKRHHPHYNARLKDDKTFPYLKINMKEEWPGIYVTRRLVQDGSYYFGPFANAGSVRQVLKTVKHIFPFRSCSDVTLRNNTRACLWYHIGKCLAPCIGAINRQEYLRMLKEIVLFLKGRQEKVIKELENRMQQAVDQLEFERAALIRDQINSIQQVIEGQKIAARVAGEQDAIALVSDRDETYVQVFFIRNGRLVGHEGFVVQGTRSEEPAEIMTSFVKQFYNSSPYIPPQLVLQYPVDDKEVIENWLASKKGAKVHIQVPLRGNKKQLIDTVAENARQGMEQLKIKRLSSAGTVDEALGEIQEALNLPRLPVRIEGYDISNIQGTAAVGSMVVFEKGKPRTAHYRRFKIKEVTGADDYAMVQEVLRRRFRRGSPVSADNSTPDTWAIVPDLVVIDGGKGQLNAALTVMKYLGVENVPLASLAKENEELFVPGKRDAIILPRTSPGLRLLQRLRDEAHRFALGYHLKVRKKASFSSSLDGVTGIGPKRKRALLRKFGSVRGIQQAGIEELAAVAGMNLKLAQSIKENL